MSPSYSNAHTENISSNGAILRIPPNDKAAEMAVLGSLMIDSNAPLKIMDMITGEDFYRDHHGSIFKIAAGLYEKREPIDIISISTKLKEKNVLDQIGGVSYLTELVNSVPTAANITHYADIIRKKRILRDLIEASHHINQLGYQEDGDVETLLDDAERKIFSISKATLRQNFIPVRMALEEAFERIDHLHKNKGDMRGVPTGFKDLDHILSGLQASDLIILACRPSMGKTSLALDIARNAAVHNKIPVGIFSLEMSKQQLIDRLLSAESRLDLWKIRNGRLSDDEFPPLRDALDRLSSSPLFIDDEASVNIMQMRAKARRMQTEHGLGLIIVDYLQLMLPRVSTDSMVAQITEISRSLKGLARELNVPVLALSQLSRAVEQRPNSKPRLSDLRDSGSIEQDADVVMFIYREDKYKEETKRPNQVDIMIEKHRNGPTGKTTLYFNKDRASFSMMEDGHTDYDF